jgi:hypothetical protein
MRFAIYLAPAIEISGYKDFYLPVTIGGTAVKAIFSVGIS